MESKVSQVLDHITKQLESGKLKSGDKLPGARDIARELKISFAKVQQSIELLVNEGILESIPRKGTFVQHKWNERILQTNISLFAGENRLPWLPGFKEMLAKELPGLRISTAFPKSTFEIRTTWSVQSEHGDYMNLAEIFNECYPDKSEFFTHPFKTFYMDGKLSGLPIIFSPRVLFYNTEILKKANCRPPSHNWPWNDFISCIKKIKQALPETNIINWYPGPHLFMNFIFRAGGALLSYDKNDPVMIDHPRTRYGIKLFRELRNAIGFKIPDDYRRMNAESFINGEMAFMVSAREELPLIEKAGLKNWGTAPLPHIEGGLDITAQATDLLCVRKSCTDINAVTKMVKLMLSEELQNYIGKLKYGIPIRKSSALKSIDIEDPRDFLFITEAPKITAEYNIDSPELAMMIKNGIGQILESDTDIDASTRRLADAVRTFLSIRDFTYSHREECAV